MSDKSRSDPQRRIAARSPADAAARRALDEALALHRQGRLADALVRYRALVARAPDYADAQNLMGLALYQSGDHRAALAAIDAALALNDAHPDYRNHRGIVLLAMGRADEAAAEFRRVLESEPRHAQALANLGNALKATGDLAGAMDRYRRAIELQPNYAEAWFNLGNAQRESGSADDAAASYRRALAINPRFAAAQANLGALLIERGDAVGARQAYEGALASGGERPSILYGLALACERLGDAPTAEEMYRRLLARTPDHADALNNLAGLTAAAGRDEEAEALYGRALAANATHDRAAYNLGALHARRGQADQAARYLLMAKSLGDDAERLTLVGRMLQRIDRTDDAIDCFERVVALRPEDVGAHTMLGALLLERRETERGIEHLDYAEAEGGNSGFLHHQLGLGQFRLCNLAGAIERFRRAIERDPATLAYRSSYLMALNYDDAIGAEALFEEHRRIMAPVNDALPVPLPFAAREPGARLRIGYVSADFRAHSCANFLLPLFEAHDRDRFEIVAYANTRRQDAVTRQFQALADRWRDIVMLDDAAAAATIRADGIDLLIDAGGHTGDNRLGVFAHRPAPVQATWLGYPNTTALATIGHRLVDGISDPASSDRLATETLRRIEGGFLAYRPRLAVPDPAPRTDDRLRFGCFNNAGKISDTTIRLWAQLLAACPDAVLALRSEQYRHRPVRDSFLQRFASAGVDPARIEFPDWQNELDDALAGYSMIDIALDPTPYNGTTTTFEALWMGVPVVTLAGDRHAARVGAAILGGIGLDELVATTPADYVAIAAGLAQDRNRRAAWRQSLRGSVAASPPGDGRRLAAAIEAFALEETERVSRRPA